MKNYLLALSILLSTLASGQLNPEQAIKDLKEGTLIVNLIIPSKKIESLRQKGDKKASLKLQKEIEEQNRAIISAFAKAYTFSKVLFIYSYNMGDFFDGDPTVLFNSQGNAQSTLPDKYLFVEFSETQERSIDGFVMKDRNRDFMKKPFPYFISNYKPLRLGRRSFLTMTEILNEKLNVYHSAVVK